MKTLFGVVPERWLLMSRHLLASLLYHLNWMKNTINNTSGAGFLGIALFRRDMFGGAKDLVVTTFPWTDEGRSRQATGIPQAVIDFNYHQQELQVLKELPDKISGQILTSLVKILDERQIGGGDLSAARLHEEFFKPLEAQFTARLDKFEERLEQKLTCSQSQSPSTGAKGAETARPAEMKLRMLPVNYTLNTKLSILDAWICYHIGEDRSVLDSDGNVKSSYTTPPWKTLQRKDLKMNASQKGYLANLNFLCSKLDHAVGLRSVSKPTLSQLTEFYRSRMVQNVLEELVRIDVHSAWFRKSKSVTIDPSKKRDGKKLGVQNG